MEGEQLHDVVIRMVVNVKVGAVPAKSQREAIDKAENWLWEQTDHGWRLHGANKYESPIWKKRLTERVQATEPFLAFTELTDETNGYVVDEVDEFGQYDENKTGWYDLVGNPESV